MVAIKGHSCKMSYIWFQKSVLVNNSPNSKASPILKPPKPIHWLLLLTLCGSFSIFRLSFSPFPATLCVSDQNRLPGSTATSRESGSAFFDFAGSSEDGEFWKQPNGLGFRPCLNFSKAYREGGDGGGSGKRKKFLMVVVSGGLNQQRNQIVDAVVIARILGATLVIPILKVNLVWSDESEFSDIFDDGHFKETLKDDVPVVSSLPASHLRTHPVSAKLTAGSNVDEQWIRTHILGRLNRSGVLLLRGFDSKLSKDLNPDLQKLRCKVAFHALKFRAPIEELGNKLAEKMAKGGPYLALHLRLEMDVWVRTGCLPGLGEEADRAIEKARALHPELLTARSNITARDRYLAGLCPLNALEIARLLKGLGATPSTRIYWAGGEPFGGDKALLPLRSQFPHLYNKKSPIDAAELGAFNHKASILAALDYIVCLKSQVFMANHGGNMARAMQGHRAYVGHRKHIRANKKVMVHLLRDKRMNESEMDEFIKKMHSRSLGSPLVRTSKARRDVIAFPVPECMCSRRNHTVGEKWGLQL